MDLVPTASTFSLSFLAEVEVPTRGPRPKGFAGPMGVIKVLSV